MAKKTKKEIVIDVCIPFAIVDKSFKLSKKASLNTYKFKTRTFFEIKTHAGDVILKEATARKLLSTLNKLLK